MLHLTAAQAAQYLRLPKGPTPKSSRSRNLPARFDWADCLMQQIRALRLPEPVREFRPFADRRWRIDCAWPTLLLGAELDGAEHQFGRHARGKGMANDAAKFNRLQLDGWVMLRFVGSQVRSGYAIETIREALK